MEVITKDGKAVRTHEAPRGAARSVAARLSVPLEVLASLVMVALSFGVYHATGLHEAAESNVLKVGLGVAIAFWFVMNVRTALHDG
jgi:hypothetical protein